MRCAATARVRTTGAASHRCARFWRRDGAQARRRRATIGAWRGATRRVEDAALTSPVEMPTVVSITSRANPLLQGVRRLTAQPDAYRKQGRVWLEGEHLCSAWIARHGGADVQLLIDDAAWRRGDHRGLVGAAAAVAVLPADLMRGLGTLESPAPIALVAAWPGAGRIEPGLPSVVLDRLQDPGNVGSVLRSAAAFGFRQVVALQGTAALWSPKVLRAGMGAHVGLRLVESATQADLDALALPLVGTSSHAADAVGEAALPWPCAWVFGHEGQGLDAALDARCAQRLRIPQPGGEESLNVAAAAAVCLHESVRRLGVG